MRLFGNFPNILLRKMTYGACAETQDQPQKPLSSQSHGNSSASLAALRNNARQGGSRMMGRLRLEVERLKTTMNGLQKPASLESAKATELIHRLKSENSQPGA